MKKLLCLLFALLLPFAALAESESSISLANHHLYAGDNATLLHLRFKKTGELPFIFNGVTVELVDAQGQPITPIASEPLEKPITEVPAGNHYFTTTLGFILPEGVEAADFNITGISGFFEEAQTPVCLQQEPGYLLAQNDVYQMMAWVIAEENTTASQYFLTADVADAEGYYLGSVYLPNGLFRFVSGADMLNLISDATGWTHEQLTEKGFSFPCETYAFCDWIDLPYLDTNRTPAAFYPYAYTSYSNVATGHVGLYTDAIRIQPDGSFVIEGLLSNDSQEHFEFQFLRALTLYDASGNTAACTDFICEYPHRVLGSNELFPYRITGSVQPGFLADSFLADFALEQVDALDHQRVSVITETLPYHVEAPISGVPAEDYYLLNLYFTAGGDNFFGLTWTTPDQAWSEDGEIYLQEPLYDTHDTPFSVLSLGYVRTGAAE